MTHESEPAADFLSILRAERRDLINLLRTTRFTTLKDGYPHAQVVPFATYSPWLSDERFQKVYAEIGNHTMVDIYRCYELYLCASQLRTIDGDIVEVGVWRGGAAALMASALPEKRLHLFDTFCGVPKTEGEFDTLYRGGEHSDTDLSVVEELLRVCGRSAEIHVGIFPDETLMGLPHEIAIAHVDVDTYRSAAECFSAIWPRVQRGGILLFDDYGFFGCEGVTQAVTELRATTHDATFVHNLNGHGLFIKR